MSKYNQETKDKAVEMAKKGIALKTIQLELGPNPKATQRYLKKVGIDYTELREQLKKDGKLQGHTKEQVPKGKKPVQKNTETPKVTEKA